MNAPVESATLLGEWMKDPKFAAAFEEEKRALEIEEPMQPVKSPEELPERSLEWYKLALSIRDSQLLRAQAEIDRLLSAAVPVEGTEWIEIKEGCEMPEVEDLVLIVTKEPEMRLVTMGGHRDTFWNHLHNGSWNIHDVERWRHVEARQDLPTLQRVNNTLTRTIAIQIETIATLRADRTKAAEELAEMTKDRDLWQEAHDEDCPNKAMVDELREELREKSAWAERWHRVVETVLTVQGLSPALGANEAATALIAELARERERHQWIPCEQELPPMGATVIVQGGIAFRTEGEWISQTGAASGRPIMWPVTHWMHIPELEPKPAPVATGEEK